MQTMTLAVTEKKTKKVTLKSQNLLSLSSNYCFGTIKIDRSNVSSSTSKLFPTTINTITK